MPVLGPCPVPFRSFISAARTTGARPTRTRGDAVPRSRRSHLPFVHSAKRAAARGCISIPHPASSMHQQQQQQQRRRRRRRRGVVLHHKPRLCVETCPIKHRPLSVFTRDARLAKADHRISRGVVVVVVVVVVTGRAAVCTTRMRPIVTDSAWNRQTMYQTWNWVTFRDPATQ